MFETLKEFMESYEGFDFSKGTIVLTKLESGVTHIIDPESCWTFLLEEYSEKTVWSWTHTETIMAITINC